MKKTKLLAGALSACFLFAATGCNLKDVFGSLLPSGNDDGLSSVNVIMVNDNHGVLNEETGSFDKIATGIDSYESLGDTIKIANGDMFQGTYVSSSLKGLPMLDALNALDFDAFVIGNHEFDWGLDEMKKYKDGDPSNGEAEFPFLGANIYDKSTNAIVDWLEPYTVIQLDEVKIGIIGIIGQVESSILSANMEDYAFVEAGDIVKDLATELRREKDCDAVIVASHGVDNDLNVAMATYEGPSKIDGIFTGHTHVPTEEKIERDDGSRVWVLQNGGYGESFACMTLKFDANGCLQKTEGGLKYTDKFQSKGILSEVFAKYAEQLSIGDQVLLTIGEDISRYDTGSNVVYSMYATYDVDFAVINGGGVRTGIEAGDVTYADLFQVLPFENEVYIVTLSGRQLKSYVNAFSSGIYYYGLRLEFIEDDKDYQMAIVDFVYLGYTFDDYRNDSCIDTNDLIRDVFIDFVLSSVS